MIWSLENIEHSYKDFTLKIDQFQGIPNEAIALIGPNGAGKTTTLNILSGLIRPDQGEVKVFDSDQFPFAPYLYESIGFIGEKNSFYAEATVRFNLDLISSFYKTWDFDFQEELIRQFKLDITKKVKNLSRGNLVKLSLICCLSHHPKLLILDEAFVGLDPVLRERFLQILNQLKEQQELAMVFSSHILEDVERIADRFVLISNGKILYHFQKQDFYQIESDQIDQSLKENPFWQNDQFAYFNQPLKEYQMEKISSKDLILKILREIDHEDFF